MIQSHPTCIPGLYQDMTAVQDQIKDTTERKQLPMDCIPLVYN